MQALVRRFGQNYAWIVVGAVFVVVMVSAGMRSTPGVLLVPIEGDMHWTRA